MPAPPISPLPAHLDFPRIANEALEKWKKATDALDDEWMQAMTKAGHDGPKLFKSAQDLIKKHTKK